MNTIPSTLLFLILAAPASSLADQRPDVDAPRHTNLPELSSELGLNTRDLANFEPLGTIQVRVINDVAGFGQYPQQPSLLVEISDVEISDVEISNADGFELTASVSWYEQTGFRNGQPFVSGVDQLWQQQMAFQTRFDDHNLTLGTTYRTNAMTLEDLTALPMGIEESGTAGTDWTAFSLFTEDVWQPSDSLTFSLGLRYDRFEWDNEASMLPNVDTLVLDRFSPRIGAAYEITKDHNLSIAYQQGLSSIENNAYYLLPLMQGGSADRGSYDYSTVEPETIDSFELSYQWDITIGLSLGINVFHNEIEGPYSALMPEPWLQPGVESPDNMRQDAFSSPAWNPVRLQNMKNPDARSQATGSELIVRYQVLQNTRTNMSYGYVDTKQTSLQTRPIHQLKMGITSEFFNNRLRIGGNFLFNTSLDDEPSAQPEAVFEDRHFVDVFATYQITERWSGSFRVENLLETDVDRLHFETSIPVTGMANERKIYFSITRY